MDPEQHHFAETTVRVNRSRRLIQSTIPSLAIHDKAEEASKNAKGKEKSLRDDFNTSDDDNDESTNPHVSIMLQSLLNVITNIFAEDKISDNALSMSSFVKADFTDLELLGRGTSFIVRRLRDVPQGYAAAGIISSSRRAVSGPYGPDMNKQLVSKQLLATRWPGRKERSKQLLELVINEIQIITHYPLKMHENIIKFRGIMWEYDMNLQVWPVLVLEYAAYGTLSDFQARPLNLTFGTKMNLCLDVGNGLEALHLCGIVHGDIKSENVLVFPHAERGYIAKLGDFSSSTMSFPTEEDLDPVLDLLGYTPVWVAPEYSGPAPFSELLLMDVFAFGLLVWTVVCNGFRFFMDLDLDGEENLQQLKDLKLDSLKLLEITCMVSLKCCGDVDIEPVVEIFANTVREPAKRNLGTALDILKRTCKDTRTGVLSRLRKIEDPHTGIFGTKIKNIDLELLSRFPRPLQKGILQNSWALMPEYESDTGQRSKKVSASHACLISRLILMNTGPPTMGELVVGYDLDYIAFESDLGDEEKLANSLLRTDRDTIHELIRGSICDGSPTFGPASYYKYRNRRTTSSLKTLAMCAKADAEYNDATRMLCIKALALGRSDMIPEEKMTSWIRLAMYTTNLNLMRVLYRGSSADQYAQRKRDVLELVAQSLEADALAQEFRRQAHDLRGKSTTNNRQLFQHFRKDLFDALPLQHLKSWAAPTVDDGSEIEAFETTASRVFKERVPAQNFTLHSLAGYISCIKDLELVLERLGDDVSSLQNRDAAGRTPLLLSCMSGNYPATKLFLERGADTSVQSDIGQGVLHFLHVFDPSEQYDIAAEAMRGGADPNALISAGEDLSLLPQTPATTVLYVANGVPLHHAILHNDLAAVKILLSHGANCLIENSEFVSALGLSASLHCSEILDHLLETNDVDVAKWYDHYGNNLVHAALDDKWDELRMFVHISDYFSQAEKTLSVLRQKGADWEKLSQAWQIPALHFATLKSSVNILSLLLKSGLKYQIDMPSSISLPLHTAIKRGDEHKFILLLENGANVHLQAEGTGDSCLHLCIKTAFEDAFFVETLVKYNAEVDAVNHAGETPFCLAVARKQFKTATLLLKLGADVNHVDYENTTILGTLLTRYDNVLPCLKYLLEPGHHLDPANFIVESRGHSTALHLAAGARYTKRLPNELAEIMSYLLTKFPFEEHLEAKEITSGFTPLFCAVLGNNFDAVRALLATGASLDTQANAGVSLRGAKFIWLYGLSLGLFKDETHSTEDEAFIQKWKRMSRILLQASEEPVVLPKKRQKSAKDDPLFRFDTFMQIATSAGLHSPESVGGMDIYKLPEEGLLKDEEKLKLFVPKDYLAEALVLTNDNIKRCPFIVEAIGYFFTRQKNRERYALTLLMPHGGVVNSLGGFLQSSPSVPFSQRLQICLDIVTAVQVVHESGFTHGCLNPNNVFILSVEGRPESSYCSQLWNFEKSVSIEDDPLDKIYVRQDNDFDATECRDQEQTAMTFEELKKCDIFSLGALLLFIFGNGEINSPGSVESNPTYYKTAITRAIYETDDDNVKRAIADVLIPCLEGMVEASQDSRAKGVRSISFALGVVLEASRGYAR